MNIPFHSCDREGYTFLAWVLSLFITLMTGLLLQEHTENKRFLDNQRRSVVEQLSTLRARLEGELNAELLLTRSLIAEIVIHADIDQETFSDIAQHLMEESKHIRKIGLAKGTVVTYVYPEQGNEAAVGMDYKKNIQLWPAVRKAIEENKTIVAGPLTLVQGGNGLISRTPIFIRRPGASSKKYFGILSVVINVPSLLKAAGVVQEDFSLALSLRGKDDLDTQGHVFYGRKDTFTQDPVLLEVILPGGTWLMAAIPVKGWKRRSPNISFYRVATSAVALLLLFLLILHQYEIKNRKIAEAERNRLIQEMKGKNKALLEQALTDPLTGLYNRRAIASILQKEINRNTRFGHISSILLADIDYFKKINDNYGHISGDTALKTVADQVKKSIRNTDSFARWGGEEFLILAPETSLHNGGICAEKIRRNVEATEFPQGMAITLSIGVAEFKPAEDLDLWIQRADKALYKAKSSGRNRVELDDYFFQNNIRQSAGQQKKISKDVSDFSSDYDRRYAILPVLENELNRSSRSGHVSSILLAEIDQLEVTDRHESFGNYYDAAMHSICSTLSEHIRHTDTFARWEGKKILLLAPETSLRNANFFAEKIRNCIKLFENTSGIKANINIGIAELKPHEELDNWIKRADKALTQAKSCE